MEQGHQVDEESFDKWNKYLEGMSTMAKISLREAERRAKRVSEVRVKQYQYIKEAEASGQGITAYDMGLYNGLEVACAVLFNRKLDLLKIKETPSTVQVIDENPQIPVEDDEVGYICIECGKEVAFTREELMEEEHGPVEGIVCKECCAKTPR